MFSLIAFLRDNAVWLAAGILFSFMSSFGQTFFISVFAGHIRAEYGLSHGEWGGIYALGTGASALVMVWAGGLTDRYSARGLGMVVLALVALACVAMSLSVHVAVLTATIFLLRFAGQGMTSHVAIVATTRWFHATRGRALAITALGFALGEALLPMIFVSLMNRYDWRDLWLVAAGIVLVGVALIGLLLRRDRRPQSTLDSDHSTGIFGRHWTRPDALRHWLFWLMIPVVMGPPAFITSFFFHQVSYAEINGWDHLDMVVLFPAYTLVAVLSSFAWGMGLDRVGGTGRLMPWSHLPIAAAFLAFGLANTLTGLAAGLCLMALTTGALATLPMAFWAEHFGTRHIGSIKAAAVAAMVLGSALGPGVTGYLMDHGIGLASQYVAIAGWFLISSAMMAIGLTRAGRLFAVAP